jgi:hypothetical protein
MSATASENPALHDHLVTGETLFVAGAVLAFLSDVALTFLSLVNLHWTGVVVGGVFILGTLYIINWLYTGKKEARTPAAIWAIVQIVIALVGTILLLNLAFRWDYRFYDLGATLPANLSIHSYVVGAFKVAAYGLFLYLVTQRGPALFFLRHRGGEAVEAPSPTAPPEDVHPTGTVLPLTAEQTDKANALANTLQCAGFALMAAGFFEAIVGGQRIASNPRVGWVTLGEGVIYLALGLLTLGPISSVRNIKDRGADTAYIGDALSKLGGLFNKQLVLTVALIALTIVSVIRLAKG